MTAKKILIVEDDADQRLAIGVRLRGNDFTTVFAADAPMALSAAQRERPDLILLDLGLPGGDGFRVLERLRAIPQLSGIPTIVVTARDAGSSEDRALDLGAVAFFQKPVDSSALLGAIRQVLGKE
jgi:two-component system cell cycle response regulator